MGNRIANSNDQIRFSLNRLASEGGEPSGLSFGGVALDHEVTAFDVPETAQCRKKQARAVVATGLADQVAGNDRGHDSDSMLAFGLRPRRPRSRREHGYRCSGTGQEIP